MTNPAYQGNLPESAGQNLSGSTTGFVTCLTNAGCHDHDAALTAYVDVVLVEGGQASVRVLGR